MSELLCPNWKMVAKRSISFVTSAIASVVGVAAAIDQFTPIVVPYLSPKVAAPLLTTLAIITAVGRLMNQNIAQPKDIAPPAWKPPEVPADYSGKGE